jgi:GTPase SAR1 family protein
MTLPKSFLESNFRTRKEYDESLLLPDAERLAAETAAAAAADAGSMGGAQPAVSSSSARSSTAGSSRGGDSSSSGAAPSGAPSRSPDSGKKPTAVIIIGMAGSGKTTLMQRLNAYLHSEHAPYYMVNLDPAVLETPFGAHVDIRDTVNYREVMKQYSLGPNGGILTALNLFATKFDQVLNLIEKRASTLDYALFDTPGQIEIFTWSASGQIITESLASSFPTVIVYVIDTVRCQNAVTFMSNMLYACSILYKLKLPLVLAFNKVDAASCDYAKQWMSDLDSFSAALQQERSYMGSLATSMALMLEEFYSGLHSVGVSALTGEGMPEFFDAVGKAAEEYKTTYAVELERAKAARAKQEALERKRSEARMKADGLAAAGASVVMDGTSRAASRGAQAKQKSNARREGDPSDDDDDDDDDDDSDVDDEEDDDDPVCARACSAAAPAEP